VAVSSFMTESGHLVHQSSISWHYFWHPSAANFATAKHSKTMAHTLPCEQLNASSASAVHICQLTLLQCHWQKCCMFTACHFHPNDTHPSVTSQHRFCTSWTHSAFAPFRNTVCSLIFTGSAFCACKNQSTIYTLPFALN
jgi:hypothetical protein